MADVGFRFMSLPDAWNVSDFFIEPHSGGNRAMLVFPTPMAAANFQNHPLLELFEFERRNVSAAIGVCSKLS